MEHKTCLSESSWYIHIDNFINCPDEDFEKLWTLHEKFEVHEEHFLEEWTNLIYESN